MAKRFVSTEIWKEDWFLNMTPAYKLFWFYILGNCNHAGIFRVNVKTFNSLMGVKISATAALGFFNLDKKRIRVISDSVWFIEDFFAFQYGETYNENNKLHKSIENVYNQYNIKLTSIRGLKVLKEGVKDKDKEIKKGGVGENKKEAIRAVKFSEDSKGVIFEDGSYQDLGQGQILRKKEGTLQPHYVKKGIIE